MVKTVFPLTEKILVHNPYARNGTRVHVGMFSPPQGRLLRLVSLADFLWHAARMDLAHFLASDRSVGL